MRRNSKYSMSCLRPVRRFSPLATCCRWCIWSGRCATANRRRKILGMRPAWNGNYHHHLRRTTSKKFRSSRSLLTTMDLTVAHQFDDYEQQQEASTLGMWVFLATEILFFGGLFLGY